MASSMLERCEGNRVRATELIAEASMVVLEAVEGVLAGVGSIKAREPEAIPPMLVSSLLRPPDPLLKRSLLRVARMVDGGVAKSTMRPMEPVAGVPICIVRALVRAGVEVRSTMPIAED